MARKPKHEEHENHERWVISYADFITLLFAFFVVMYGMASVNEGKYKRFAASLKVAFKVFEKPTAASDIETLTVQAGGGTKDADEPADSSGTDQTDQRATREFQGFINDQQMTVQTNEKWTKIELKAGLLFESGTARLDPAAIPIIEKMSELLHHTTHKIYVEGHTDDQEISTQQFPSNWELSSARASAVVRELVEMGVNPKHLVAVGYSSYHPKVKNTDEASREMNRRVVLVIRKEKPIPPKDPDSERAKAITPEQAMRPKVPDQVFTNTDDSNLPGTITDSSKPVQLPAAPQGGIK